jgi:phosphate transport system protein
MSRHLEREIEQLKKAIIALSTRVEETLASAICSVERKDAQLAQKVIGDDHLIDSMEIDIEEECLKILALHQPVASDLRFIVAVLKINNDLERIGDIAANIAERSVSLAQFDNIDVSFIDFAFMVKKVRTMLKNSLDSLVNLDSALAYSVCLSDDEIDAMNSANFDRSNKELQKKPGKFPWLTHVLSISRSLERIADHATNIAEDVIYMIEGVIVRHRGMLAAATVRGTQNGGESKVP